MALCASLVHRPCSLLSVRGPPFFFPTHSSFFLSISKFFLNISLGHRSRLREGLHINNNISSIIVIVIVRPRKI